jgi:mono/diheme cytochrome c family protein
MARMKKPLRWAASATLTAALALASVPALAEHDSLLKKGKADYEQLCAGCHGASAMGEGKMADLLTAKPPDLTRIAKRNGGVFPFWQVFAKISGESPVRAHLLSPMPIWGERLKSEEGAYYYAPAHVRILLITHYLESIQEK